MINSNTYGCIDQFSPGTLEVLDDLLKSPNPIEDQNEKLQIIAEPKATYHPRYASEIDKDKQRPNRFIHAENVDNQHEYPTIKIPLWCYPNQQLYIRVTLVTVTSDRIPYHCIHPYAIDTSDENTIEDKPNNSIFFRINENEFNTREKSFKIIILKKKQHEFKSYGPMRLFDHEAYQNINIENPEDPKEKIALYQLFKAQFVFTIVQQQDNNPNLILLSHTSVESRIITEENIVKKNSLTNHLNIIRCIPQKGSWEGGDEIVINMTNPIKGKKYSIYFDFGQYGYGAQSINHIMCIDTKTILIQTPLCPIPPGKENLKVSIIIKDNKSIIYTIEFYYIPPMKTTDNISSYSQINELNKPISNKRRLRDVNEESEEDNEQRKHIQLMDVHRLRVILLKLQDRLSDDDRKRLHFFIGNDVPRRIRDDPSLGGTLSLLESLFDQDKINEQELMFVINAFDEIQCIDAVKLLREYRRQIQSNELNQSVQSSSLLMPSLADQVLRDQDDKYCSCLMDQKNIFNNNDPVTVAVSNQRKPLEQKHLLKQSSMTHKCLLLFILLSIILIGVMIGCCIWIIHLKIQYKVLEEHINSNGTIHYRRLNQTEDNEMIQGLAKKIKSVVVKELRNVKSLCLENSDLRSGTKFLENLACREACYTCVEDFPLDSLNEKATNNCGPMCDCADSCANKIPIKQIHKIYSQSNYTRDDEGCIQRIYTQSLTNETLSLP